MVEDSEVDFDVFKVKKKLLKSDLKHKTRYHFHDFVNAVHNFVNAVHNCERRSFLKIFAFLKKKIGILPKTTN